MQRLLKEGLKFYSPLLETAYRGDTRKLQDEIKVITSNVDSQGCTCLHYAAAAGEEKTVTWLVENGLAVSTRKEERILPPYCSPVLEVICPWYAGC